MKTQTDIGKTKKWAILFIVLMALSVSDYAQPAAKCGFDKEVVSIVEKAWNDLDQLALNTENNIRYMAPSPVNDPEESTAEKSAPGRNSVPILLVESSQERKDELKSNPRSHSEIIQVGYYQKSKNTAWYKMRSIVTRKPADHCNICTRVVSTPYIVYVKR